MTRKFSELVEVNKLSNLKRYFSFQKTCFGVSVTVGLILSGVAFNKPNKLYDIVGLNIACASELSTQTSWKNLILKNAVREGSLYKEQLTLITDVVNLGNGIFAIFENVNVRCYILENGEMFLNVNDNRSLDGMRDCSIQKIAGYSEMITSTKDNTKSELNPKSFIYCGQICKTPYVLCSGNSNKQFSLINNVSGREITQEDYMDYFIAQCNISRTYKMSQLSQIMSKQKGEKGFRICVSDLMTYTHHFKIMRPKHLKVLFENKRIDSVSFHRLLKHYFSIDGILQEMINDKFYRKISTHFGDPISLEEIDYYIDNGWLDKKAGEKLKKKFK